MLSKGSSPACRVLDFLENALVGPEHRTLSYGPLFFSSSGSLFLFTVFISSK